MKRVVMTLLCILGAATLWVGSAQASCTAKVICQVTIIQCSGQSICESGPDWVRCDGGEQIFCPICQAQTTCCDGRFIYCNGYESCEENPGRWVKCDGQFKGFCPFCQGALPGGGEGESETVAELTAADGGSAPQVCLR